MDLSGQGLKSVIVGEELSKASNCSETPWAWKALAGGKVFLLHLNYCSRI